ncbi:MAG TPA: type II secretion system protein GspC [Myxococcota bacterium]|nr:type II secretion system protein GspC [Myxococcota bacterium]
MNVPRPWLIVGALTASAGVAAIAVNQGIARLVALPDEAPAAAPVADPALDGAPVEEPSARQARWAARAEQAQSQEEYLRIILDRNIFDQSKAGLRPEGDSSEPVDQPSDFKAQLKGTIVAVPATYSAAFLLKDGDPFAYAYGVGQIVMGATILEIQKDRIRILVNGHEEWLSVGGGKETAKTETTAAGPATPVAEGVEQLSETEFNVDKSLIESNLNDLEGLSRLGRALLHRGADGEYDGYRLSAIRRGTLADQLGIRNGDIIHSVNGTTLNSVQGAMEAFQGLTGGMKSGSSFKFEVTRRGQPVTLNYNVK